jgi:multisubunit Na+/H+ antiporter MnhC subunit
VSISPVKAASRTIVVPDNYQTITDAIDNARNVDSILVQQSTTQQNSQQKQPLPSPLIIAALIIALVALFGAILSLYLRWRDKKFKN